MAFYQGVLDHTCPCYTGLQTQLRLASRKCLALQHSWIEMVSCEKVFFKSCDLVSELGFYKQLAVTSQLLSQAIWLRLCTSVHLEGLEVITLSKNSGSYLQNVLWVQRLMCFKVSSAALENSVSLVRNLSPKVHYTYNYNLNTRGH